MVLGDSEDCGVVAFATFDGGGSGALSGRRCLPAMSSGNSKAPGAKAGRPRCYRPCSVLDREEEEDGGEM